MISTFRRHRGDDVGRDRTGGRPHPALADGPGGPLRVAAGVLTVGSTRSFDVGLVGFAIMGMSHVLVAVNIATSMQVHVQERFRARVTSLYLTALLAAIPVGAFVGGAIGDWVGLQVAVRGFGIVLAFYALFAAFFLGALRQLDGTGLELEDEPA